MIDKNYPTMTRDEMIEFIKANPGVKIAHRYFSTEEYIVMRDDGNVYTEEGYLFEDWYSIGPGAHSGIRDRVDSCFQTGWFVKC